MDMAHILLSLLVIFSGWFKHLLPGSLFSMTSCKWPASERELRKENVKLIAIVLGCSLLAVFSRRLMNLLEEIRASLWLEYKLVSKPAVKPDALTLT